MESKIRKTLVNVYSLVLSIFVCFIVGVALSKIPDKVDMQALENLMLSGAFKQCRPEKAETLQYMILTVLFPVLYMVFIPLIKKRSDNSLFFSQKMLNLINFAIFLTFAILVLIILLYSDTSYSSISLNLFCGNLAIAMIISLVVSVVFILIGSRNKKNVGCLYFLLALAFIAYVFAKLISKNYASSNRDYLVHHYYAWWYPIYNVFSSKTIGVDFNSIYGFYPYIAVAFLKIIGGVTQANMSLMIAIALCVMSFEIFSFSYVFIQNKTIAFLMSLSACTLGPLNLLYCGNYYFQYFPLRSFFPISLLFLISIHYATKSRKAKHIIAAVAWASIALALFCNFESGIICIIVFAGYVILQKAYLYTFGDPKIWKTIFAQIFCAIVSILIFICTVQLITYLRSGQALGINELFFGILAFEGTGFYMLPISFGLWIVYIIVLVYALYSALPKLKSERVGEKQIADTRISTALFVLAIYGFCAFSYFVGRSYSTNIYTLLFITCLICAVAADDFLARNRTSFTQKKEKRNDRFMLYIKLLCCFLVISFCVANPVMVIGDNVLSGSNSSFDLKWVGNSDNENHNDIDEVAYNINDWATNENNGENPRLFIYWAAFVNEINHEKTNYSACEQIDWFYKSNAHSYIDSMNSDTSSAFVIDNKAVDILTENMNSDYQNALKKYTLVKTFVTDTKVGENHTKQLYYIYVPSQE